MSDKPNKPRVRRWRRFLAVAFLLLAVLAVTAGAWPEKFLVVDQKPEKADAIVILGGGLTFRVPRALELYHEQFAPLIVVTGRGDGDEMCRWLVGNGVPDSAMRCETESKNTWQNAQYSVPLLRKAGAKRVILVTSWFHSRRALACFRKTAPEMEFISVPTIADRPGLYKPTRKEWWMTRYEYLKVAGYWVRYGVRSF